MRPRIGKTLVGDVLAELRSDIFNGRLEPGARLKMGELSARLAVSLSVLREALNRLVEQGLVVLEPQVGFHVVPLSAADLIDLTAARAMVEAMACRRTVLGGDHQWEAELLSAHHLLSRTAAWTDQDGERSASETWIEAHRRFHTRLLAGCGSSRLVAVAGSLRDSAEVYRQWSSHGANHDRDIEGEHRAIVDAALARDADTASTLLADHIQRTTDLLLIGRDAIAEAGQPG